MRNDKFPPSKQELHALFGRFLLAVSGLLCFSSCNNVFFSGPHHPFGKHDYAVRLAQPYPSEVRLARKRLQNFVRRADASQLALLARYPVVAVQAGATNVASVPGLTHQLGTGRIASTKYDAEGGFSAPAGAVGFLLLFDYRTGRLYAPEGVLVYDKPERGSVARFAGVSAVYAGEGWW
jgi:hypothetical protein